uniref:Uncharacterized protein n=1 Tax=Rhipicephalus microplus TaxID=6941 RepID=A0A6G5A1J1_RHIMP
MCCDWSSKSLRLPVSLQAAVHAASCSSYVRVHSGGHPLKAWMQCTVHTGTIHISTGRHGRRGSPTSAELKESGQSEVDNVSSSASAIRYATRHWERHSARGQSCFGRGYHGGSAGESERRNRGAFDN